MQSENFIIGKDASLEFSIDTMQSKLAALGFHIEERSWLNPVDGVWSVHVRERDCPLMFTNGKGASKQAALASALGEYFERLSCNYFWNHYYLGEQYANGGAGRSFVHYPQEQWFQPGEDGAWPQALLTPELHKFYNPMTSIHADMLVDFNSGDAARGICAIPYVRQRDAAVVHFPVTSSATFMSATVCRLAIHRPKRAPRHYRKFLKDISNSVSSVKAFACPMCRRKSSIVIHALPPASARCAPPVSEYWLRMLRSAAVTRS